VRTVPVVVTIALANAKTGSVVEQITATREHPFFVEGQGFVPAGGLTVGNAIVTRAGPPLFVKRVEWHRRAEGYAVYNLVVEDDHTYFVGKTSGGLWAHNGISCGQEMLPFDDLPHTPPPMDLDAAAKDLHGLLGSRTQNETTTAILAAVDSKGTWQTIVASSDPIVPLAIRRAMQPGWVAAKGPGHAEVTAIMEALGREWTPLTVGASRPICFDCANQIFKYGVSPVSPVRIP
jgi:hypothetical protein